MSSTPRKVTAKITRTVTEIAIVTLDRDGAIETIDDIREELDSCDEDVLSIISVITVQ